MKISTTMAVTFSHNLVTKKVTKNKYRQPTLKRVKRQRCDDEENIATCIAEFNVQLDTLRVILGQE